MHQPFSPANGATMAHQQNYSSVPPSQQQQQQPTGQPNHNQQPPGAGPQRHHQNYPTYATQTAQTRPQQPGAGSHPNQQGQRILQQYSQQGNNPQAHTQNYIPGHPQGQQGYGLQHVTQLAARPAGPPATAYYNVPPGAQPIMTIHSPNFAMFPQNGPRQQIPAQQYFHHNQQMALSGHNPAMAAVAAAQGQPQQPQPQVLYNYPPTLYPAFQQHITGPPPMMATPGQPPQIAGMHPAQPPPQGTQSGQAVQPQASTGGQQSLTQQHIQQNQASHPTGGPPQGQQPTPAHQPPGVSRPQPTPTPPILIPSGTAPTHQIGHPAGSSSTHPGIINHPMGPPPQGISVHEQSTQPSAPPSLQYGRAPHHKPYNETKRQRKGIAIIDPETRKEVVVTKSASNSIATDTDAQKEAPTSVDKDTPDHSTIPTKESESPAIETKQHTIAEFKSKVIQAKSEGKESESAMKKKSQETSINTGQGGISDKGKNLTITTHSQIHTDTLEQSSVKDITEQVKPGKGDLTSDDSENKKATLVNLEKGNIANGNNQKLAPFQSKLKPATDISITEKMQDGDNTYNKTNTTNLKNNMNEIPEARKVDTSEQSLCSTNIDEPPLYVDSVQSSTPSRQKSDAKGLENVSTTPLPDCANLNSSSVPSFASAAKSKDPSDETISNKERVDESTLPMSEPQVDNKHITPITTAQSGEEEEDSNRALPKNTSGKAKKDEINKNETGKEMGLFLDTNTVENEVSSSVTGQSINIGESAKVASDEISLPNEESNKPYNTKSQGNDTDELKDIKPSKDETSDRNVNDDVNAENLNTETKVSNQEASDLEFTANIKNETLTNYLCMESENQVDTLNHINENVLISMDTSMAAAVGSDVTIIENGITDNKPPLKYEYKPDQWSPINVEGKKQYDREFLMKLQQDPLSMTKPDNLPNMDIIKEKAQPKIPSGIPKADGMFTPSFVKPTISNRGPPANRANSRKKEPRPGSQSSGQNQRVLILPEVNKPVVLHEAENAWKPRKHEVDENEDEMAVLERKVRAILNKLTPQKFDKLVGQFKELEIDTSVKLELCMELVFEKALDEPDFSVAYAKMCEVLKDKGISSQSEEDPKKVMNFKRMLIATCQREFYRDYMEGLNKEKFDSDIEAAESEVKRKEIERDWGVRETRARKRSLGNIRFIGELYKLKMLTVRIMHECVNKLLIPNHTESLEAREESLECLCKLLTTVGKDLDEETIRKINEAPKGSNSKPPEGIKKLDVYFTQMANVIDSKQTSSRIRFRLQDLIDLRRNRWIPRRESDGPKKIDAIHADIAREKTLQQLHDHNVGHVGGQGSRDGSKTQTRERDGRANVGDARKRSSRGPQGVGGVPTDQEGWNTVPSRPPTKVQEKFDPSKISGLTSVLHKKDDISLGMRPMGNAFSNWGKGSGGNRLSQSKEDPRSSPMPRNQNRYASLYTPGERSVSPSGQPLSGNFDRQGSSGSQSPTSTLERQHRGGSSGSRSMGPIGNYRVPNRGPNESASERERMLQGARQHMPGNSAYEQTNFAKNGPPGVATIARKPSSFLIGPSEEEIKKNQMRMEGTQIRKLGTRGDNFERSIKNILDEYLNSCDDKEVESTVRESLNSDVMANCVEVWINHAMEHRDSKSRQNLAKLLITLVNTCLLQRAQCSQGLSTFLETAIEIKCDIPKIWDYVAELVAPLLEKGIFGMDILSTTADHICRPCDHKANEKSCLQVGSYVEAVLRILSKSVGEEKVCEMWNDAQLKWDMFLPVANIDSFVKDSTLEYTLNARSSVSISSSGEPREEIGDVLRRLLNDSKSKPNDNTGIIDRINQYLQETTGSPTGEPGNLFIRTLTTEVAESTIIGIERSDQPNSRTLDQEAMQQRAVILKRYLDAKVDRETQALFALQALVHRLEHPNKLLHQIFECLYQADVITYEGFEQWEQSKDPAEQEGKGVAIKSTTQFFTWLREVDPDEEN